MKNIKKAMIFTGVSGIIYDFKTAAYTGILLNVSDLINGIIYNKKNKKENKKKTKKK